jgi:hypothetical protein
MKNLQCLIRDMVAREVACVIRRKVREIVAQELAKNGNLDETIRNAAYDETEWYTRQVA